MTDRIELLAPAKDLSAGLAAISCGADAIYVGAPRFGARQAAGNSLDDIAQLVSYAHRYWAKVYVTLNTLLFDAELDEAVSLAHQLYQAGVDALIIQDVGLLESDLPPIPLFASTQMHNHTAARVAFLEKVGIQRAILARELSLEQIQQIRAATSIELETFIHGALCVCYSGQCSLSYAMGGRSGNRGQCAQPCRKAYRLEDGSGKVLQEARYLLSLRDLNLTDDLESLLAVGVTSFKIEGRLKDQAYVMNVVAHYRKKLDGILAARNLKAASSGHCQFHFVPDPHKTFNRSYTPYFLHGRGKALTAWDTPKSVGEAVGTVVALEKRCFTLDGTASIAAGDGLCWLDEQSELQGAFVNRVEGNCIYPEKLDGLSLGVQVYRNFDRMFLARLTADKLPEVVERFIRVDMVFGEFEQGFWLQVMDEDGNQARVEVENAKIPAEKPVQAKANIEKQLRKLGGSIFTCASLKMECQTIPFLPVAALNALRRATIEKLHEAREHHRPHPTGGPQINNIYYGADNLDFRANALNQRAVNFYQRHGVKRIEPAAESGLDLHGRRVMTTKYCLQYELEACPRRGQKAISPSPLVLVDDDDNRLSLRFNCADCVMEIYLDDLEGD